MKMESLGLSETKLFHFHEIFEKNEIKSPKRTHQAFIHMNPLSRNPGSTPGPLKMKERCHCNVSGESALGALYNSRIKDI